MSGDAGGEILNRGGGRIPYVVVGNLPYFIGSPIVASSWLGQLLPRWLVVTLQAEVAARMAAGKSVHVIPVC
jgi:16S rRNA A1518/A1519 N6-dimethyltransferase RsmA/KsgA/DIM1 with predicted DNA glycosylase/AP lyase activity